MGSTKSHDRTYPMKKPPQHKPPVPRWTLKLPDSVRHVYTIYVGVQHHNPHELVGQADNQIESILFTKEPEPVVDVFRATDGFDVVDAKVWVAYYIDKDQYEGVCRRLNLVQIWQDLGVERIGIGLWIEHFSTSIDRLETNYSRLDHKPGLSQLPGVEQPAHELTAYWGAGRDRVPASAHDLFAAPDDLSPPSNAPLGFGQRLTGTNFDNMCHIRSGQWWEECEDEERIAYEQELQATLMEGMNYLWQHPQETGTIGLRFLQNLDRDGNKTKETCGAGFHKNWADLERWSSRHPSHLAIFNGAIRHAKRFGEARKLMTWHEVSILKEAEARFEYVNCDPRTGVIKWIELQAQSLI